MIGSGKKGIRRCEIMNLRRFFKSEEIFSKWEDIK